MYIPVWMIITVIVVIVLIGTILIRETKLWRDAFVLSSYKAFCGFDEFMGLTEELIDNSHVDPVNLNFRFLGGERTYELCGDRIDQVDLDASSDMSIKEEYIEVVDTILSQRNRPDLKCLYDLENSTWLP